MPMSWLPKPVKPLTYVPESNSSGDMLWALAILLGSVSLLVAGVMWWLIYVGYETNRWPSVPGVVTSSSQSVCRDRKQFRNEISYAFFVDGNKQSGWRIDSGGNCRPKEWVDMMSNVLPVGKRVTVYYNPHDLTRTVLYKGNPPGSDQSAKLMTLFSLLCWLVSFLLWCYSRWYDERHPLV